MFRDDVGAFEIGLGFRVLVSGLLGFVYGSRV